jgi:hypothetical protein
MTCVGFKGAVSSRATTSGASKIFQCPPVLLAAPMEAAPVDHATQAPKVTTCPE